MDLTGVLPISESGAERLAEGDHIGERRVAGIVSRRRLKMET